MEEAKGGELKNVLMAKFKEGTSETQIQQLIESYANLVNLVEPMKSFHWYLVPENQGTEIIKRGDVYIISNPSYHYFFSWGKELSIEKQEEGCTHVFETTFESVEGIAEFSVHPAHHDFAKVNNTHIGMEVIVCTICIALLQEETMIRSSTKQWKQE